MPEKRILIVEDEPLVALDLEEILEGAGYVVAGSARDTVEAMVILDQSHVDAAILDANLKGESAEPVAVRLRATGVPFVAVSGYTSDELSGWLGGARLLNKPFAEAELLAIVQGLCPLD
jgi:DNA-binding response OmpR family regulator